MSAAPPMHGWPLPINGAMKVGYGLSLWPSAPYRLRPRRPSTSGRLSAVFNRDFAARG